MLFVSVSEKNARHELMLGKQISQIALYNMAYEVKEHGQELSEDKKEIAALKDII